MSNHNIQEAMSHNPAKAQDAMHGVNLAHVLDSKISSRFITPHPNVDKHSPEGQALRNYSASSKEINNALIAGDHRFLNGESSVGFSKSPINYQGVKRVMAKAKPLPRDHHVYSGLGYWSPNEDNGVIHTKAFTSASHNLGTAYDFAHRTIIHFHLPKGYDKAINMKKFSSYHNEDEVLLDHDQHWKIHAVHEYTGTHGQPVKIITVKPHTPETSVNESSFHSTIHFKRDMPRSTKFNLDDKSLYSRSNKMRQRLKDAVNTDARQQHARLVSHFTDISEDNTPFIHRYTSTTGAAGINRVALEEAGHEITSIHKDRSETINGTYNHAKSVADLHGLDEEMEKHSKPLPEDVHVYSGIGHRDIGDIKEGSVVHTPAYTSSTIYPPTSKDYAGSGPRTILHFHLPEGSQHGAYIAHGSRYDNEREFLLKRNQKWRVQKIVDHRHLDSDKNPNGQFFTQQFNEGAGNGGHRVITLVPHADNVNEATIHARAVLKPSRFTKWKTDDKYVKAEAIRQRFHDAVDSDVSHQHGRLVEHYGSVDPDGDESKIGLSDKALMEYTSSARSRKLNKHALVLSGAKDAEVEYPNVDPKMVHETAKQILGEFDAHLNEHSHPLPEDMHVYSGTGLWKPGASKVGDILHTPAYTSTSLHPRTARTFAHEHIIHFQLPKGSTHGSYIGAKTFHAREKEFLLKRDQKWKVSNIEDMGTHRILSVVPHNPNVNEAFDHDPTLPAFKKKQRYATIDDFPQFRSSAEHKLLKDTHDIPDKYKAAVDAYGNGSSDINRALIDKDFTKGGNVSKKFNGYIGHDAEVHSTLIKMFDKHPSALTRDHHVYSGLGRKDPTEYMKRGIFTTPAYTSTSVKPSIAIQHLNAASSNGIVTHSYDKPESVDEHILHFHLPEGYTGGKYIQGHTAYDEHEMILRPKQKWRVVGKHTLDLGTGTAHYRIKTGASFWAYDTKKVTVPHKRHIWTVVPHEDNPHMAKQPVSEALVHDPKANLMRPVVNWNVRPALKHKHDMLSKARETSHSADTESEGRDLVAKQDSTFANMKPEHKGKLKEYTRDSGALNMHLIDRTNTEPQDRETYDDLGDDIHHIIKTHAVPLEKEHHIYSGTMHKPFSELKPGATVHTPAFTSGSININIARGFSGAFSGRTIMHFHLPEGYKDGMHIEGMSRLPHEQEYLLNRNQKWKVHAVKDYNSGIGSTPSGKIKPLRYRVVTLKPHTEDVHEATTHNTIPFRGRTVPLQSHGKHPEYTKAMSDLSYAAADDAVNQHSRLREHFDAVPYYSPLSDYTDSSDHAATTNKAAISKPENRLPSEQHNIDALSQAIRSHTTGLPEETHTYSGLKWNPSKVLEVGKSVHLPAFTSTSLAPHIALNHLESYNTKWAGDEGRTKTSREYHILHFHLPEGYKGGVFVGHRSKYAHEHEYLLDKGQKWKVVGRKTYHKYAYENAKHHVWTLTPDGDHETS